MEDNELENRRQALATAARYDTSKTADDIVKDAEKYFTFLQGSTAEPADKMP